MATIIEIIQSLIEDEHVAEIMVDGPDRVYVERSGKLEDITAAFAGEKEIIDWANGLLKASGLAPISPGQPWVESRLRDGNFLVVVTPPVAVGGPNVILHKYMRPLLTFDQLLKFEALSAPMLDFLHAVMSARLNILVAGGTASGKTTLTRLLVDLVPEDERLVVAGQESMLQIMRLKHRHVVCLESVAETAAMGGSPSMGELLHLAGHLRPDRIIAGELTGPEVKEAIDLMNTGHAGMVITLHASSPRAALVRLEMLMTPAEPGLPLPAIRSQISEALDLVVYQSRLEDGSRKIISIAQVQGLKGDNILLQELFTWEKTGITEDGGVLGRFKTTGVTPSFDTGRSAGLVFPEGMFTAS